MNDSAQATDLAVLALLESSLRSPLTTDHLAPQTTSAITARTSTAPLSSIGEPRRSRQPIRLPTSGFGVRVPGGAPFCLVSGLSRRGTARAARSSHRKFDEYSVVGVPHNPSTCANRAWGTGRIQETSSVGTKASSADVYYLEHALRQAVATPGLIQWPPPLSSVVRHRAGLVSATVQLRVSLDTQPDG
jgi:hypothetical protein